MSSNRMLVVALCSLLAVLAAGHPSSSFSDWLVSQQAAAGDHQAQTMHRHTDTITTVFKAPTTQGCRGFNVRRFETPLKDCRVGPSHNGDTLPHLWANGAGLCEFTAAYISNNEALPVKASSKLFKIGSFQARCMVQGADGCEPFDSMDRKTVELSAQGTIYRVYDALLPTNPGPLEGDCISSRLADAKKQNATKVHAQARRGSGVRVEPRKPVAGAGGDVWQVGYADVFVGTMAVVGDGSITSGMFEYVSEYDVYGQLAEPVEVPAAEVVERTVLPEPYSVTLKFYKQQTAEY